MENNRLSLLALLALIGLMIPITLHATPGDIYVADTGSGTIFKFAPDGTKSTVASGLKFPDALAFDVTGNLFVAEVNTGIIYKFTPAGVKTTFAFAVNSPQGMAFDGTGNLFVSETATNQISKFAPDGTRSTFATGLNGPTGLAFDPTGNLFVAEGNTHTISKFTPAGAQSTFSTDLKLPVGLAFDAVGNLYVTDSPVGGPYAVVKFTPTGTRSIFAFVTNLISGIAADSGLRLFVAGRGNNNIIRFDLTANQTTLASNLNQPLAVAVEPVTPAPGVVYVANQGTYNRIDLLSSNGRKSTFTSGGALTFPNSIVFDSKGNLLVGTKGSGTIQKVSPSGVQSTFASTGPDGTYALAIDGADNLFVGTTGATILKLNPSGTKTNFVTTTGPVFGLAFDASGNLFASISVSPGKGSIVKITPAGDQAIFAANLPAPFGLAFNASGDLFAAETNTIARFTSDGTQTVFASNLSRPYGLAFDAEGNLYASEYDSGSVLSFNPAGTKLTVATSETGPAGVAVERPTARPLNISTRLKVQTGDNVLFAGFIITGTDAKNVLIRGIGPSLSNFGVPGALQDPVLEVHAGATTLKSNDNWKIDDSTGNSQQAVIEGTGLAPTDARESAISIVLGPGTYTAILRGKNNTTGVGSVELYDLSQTVNFSNVANISSRGFVDTGDNVMIGGFIIGGGDRFGKVLIRAIGPSLTAFGISNPLPNPMLELHDGSGTVIDSNDDWKSDNQAAIQATGIPPPNNFESAILTTLPAGNYTAIVKGVGNGTGIGLVEVYNVK